MNKADRGERCSASEDLRDQGTCSFDHIDHIDARGKRRVYGRGDHFGKSPLIWMFGGPRMDGYLLDSGRERMKSIGTHRRLWAFHSPTAM